MGEDQVPRTGLGGELTGATPRHVHAAHGVAALDEGRLGQEGRPADMIRSIPELVAYVSTIFTLLPGDVILTGTPAGVGETRAGQRIEVEVEGIGSFSNPVVRR